MSQTESSTGKGLGVGGVLICFLPEKRIGIPLIQKAKCLYAVIKSVIIIIMFIYYRVRLNKDVWPGL